MYVVKHKYICIYTLNIFIYIIIILINYVVVTFFSILYFTTFYTNNIVFFYRGVFKFIIRREGLKL